MKPKRYVWSLVVTMKGPVLVETKSQIMAVDIRTKRYPKLAQVLIVRRKVKNSRLVDFN